MNNYTISINGYGAELVIGTVNTSEKNIINNVLRNNKDIYLEDVMKDRQLIGKDWFEFNDIYHNCSSSDDFTLTVYENDHIIHEIESSDFFTEYSDNIEINYLDIDESKDIVLSVSHQKGNFFEANIELENDFNLSNLRIEIDDEIEFSEYQYGSMVRKVTYNGIELENNGGSTLEKSFESYKNFK
jgi:hypothetical protein